MRHLRSPMGELKRKVQHRIRLVWWRKQARWQASRLGSYLTETPSGSLNCFFASIRYKQLTEESQYLLRLAVLYLEHRFDLLGSGWVKLTYGMSCRGIEGFYYKAEPVPSPDADGEWLAYRINPANLNEARRIWRLVDTDYRAIDWQLDFKSGYRWSESAWYEDIVIQRG